MRKKSNSAGIIVLVVLIAIIGALAYFYNSAMFERTAPSIELKNEIHWNLRSPLSVKVSDKSGIKFVRVTLSDGKNSIVLKNELISPAKNEYILDIKFPRTGFVSNKKYFELTVEAIDSSKWNFLAGNGTIKKSILHVDRKKPELYTVNNSYKIIKGGVATVVFKANDDNLNELYIETNFGKKFKPTPFYKDGYYVSLLAWPSTQKTFKAVIIAKDKAGNISKSRIKFYLKGKKYKVSKITLRDNFIDGKITDLTEEASDKSESMSKIEKFKFINENLRGSNEATIESITSKTQEEKLDSFSMKPFYPLKNAAAVASFGDHRYYKYKENQISESFHLGLDLASTAGANIVASNPGTVVYTKYNGIYGENLILSHGLGVYSLYGHCSSFLVSEGENIDKGQVIAKTGTTGLALGDHLHFGMLVQGIEVRPEEWMDKNWMRENIFDIINSSKKIIDRK